MKNISKEDILNSEVGKELMIDYQNYLQGTKNNQLFELFKQEQLKQKVEWEILSFKGNDGRINPITIDGRYPCNPNCHENPLPNCCHTKEYFLNKSKFYFIYSIKRLSDGEIFTLGDKVNHGIIEKFEINSKDNNELWITTDKVYSPFSMLILKKSKTPLFKDFLGNDVFEGDEFYTVGENKNIIESWICDESETGNYKTLTYFKNKSDAEEYLITNAKVLSLEDLKANSYNVYLEAHLTKLKQLIRQKLNLK